MIITLLNCAPPEKEALPSIENSYAAVASVSMDYAVGTLSAVQLDDLSVQESISTVSGDPLVFFEDNHVWQLNRFQYDTLRKYNPKDLSAPLNEISLRPQGISSVNPQDFEFCAEKLFISLYDYNALLVVDPETLSIINEIDLSSLNHSDDADLLLELADMIVVENTLFVGAQRLNRQSGWNSVGSLIAKVDCEDEELLSMQNVGSNIRIFDVEDSEIVFSSEPWEDFSAGIYTLSFGFEPDPIVTAEGIFGIENFVSHDEHIFFSSLSTDYSEYNIYCGSSSNPTLLTTTQAFVTEIAQNENEAWVGTHWGWNNPEAQIPNITRYDISTCTQIGEPIITELAPYSITFVDHDTSN
ncbi:MAG: hypothetical protein CMK59_01870 [Proteobacteria bacterium]|nr:hypothetical protein [Pseudomonadota bacterium]